MTSKQYLPTGIELDLEKCVVDGSPFQASRLEETGAYALRYS